MDEMSSDSEDKDVRAKTFATPAAKLRQAQTRVQRLAEGKEAHKAHTQLIQCAALTRIIYGNKHWRVAQADANLAHSYLSLQDFPVQAMQHANSAKYTILSGTGTPPASSEERGEVLNTLAMIFYTLGVAHLMQKNGKESYRNLQVARKFVEELQGPDWRESPELKISGKDLLTALGRACFQQNKLDLAASYFEKGIDAVISAEGETAPELITLYREIAQIEQGKKNSKKSLGYLLQAHSISLIQHKESSAETASVALLLGKAYAATGEQKHVENAEMYFNKSVTAYRAALGPDHAETIKALEDFSKWLVQIGKTKKAYNLLKESFMTQTDPCSDFNEKAVGRFYIMGSICLAEGRIREAYELLNKCAQVQVAIYGPRHRKVKEIQELLNMLEMSPTVSEDNRSVKENSEWCHPKRYTSNPGSLDRW